MTLKKSLNLIKKSSFGINNYFGMLRSRGIRLVIEYFFFNHLFDIIHGTDTHSWEFNQKNSKFSDSEIYMVTWTKDIIDSTQKLEHLSKIKNFSESNFIDIGSGKGKVLLVWRKLFPENKNIFGIEYDKNFIKITESNFQKMNYEKVNLLLGDISSLKVKRIKKDKKTIFFLFNPCGEKTLKNFFKINKILNSYIIYFNPVHAKLIENYGYVEIFSKVSYRNGSTYKLFARS